MSLHITSTAKSLHIKPTTKGELQSIIKAELERQGPDADLNFIDTSLITDMDMLFYNINKEILVGNIKIDCWDVSNVVNMRGMFYGCNECNTDISMWNISNVRHTGLMFGDCSISDSNRPTLS